MFIDENSTSISRVITTVQPFLPDVQLILHFNILVRCTFFPVIRILLQILSGSAAFSYD